MSTLEGHRTPLLSNGTVSLQKVTKLEESEKHKLMLLSCLELAVNSFMISVFCWISATVTADCLTMSAIATVAVLSSMAYAAKYVNRPDFHSDRPLAFFCLTSMLSGVCFVFIVLKTMYAINGYVTRCNTSGLSIETCFDFSHSIVGANTMNKITHFLTDYHIWVIFGMIVYAAGVTTYQICSFMVASEEEDVRDVESPSE